jgi:DNA ligase (NAD+)
MYTIEDFKNMPKDELKNLLMNASDSYYNKNESIMSDEEFDIGYNYFNTTYPKDNLSKTIGAKVKVTEWQKAKHNIPMSSLNKVNTEDEFIKWANNILNG